jgi:hypothetical protein
LLLALSELSSGEILGVSGESLLVVSPSLGVLDGGASILI